MSGYWLFRFLPTDEDDDAQSILSWHMYKSEWVIDFFIFCTLWSVIAVDLHLLTLHGFYYFSFDCCLAALSLFHCEGSGWISRSRNSGSFSFTLNTFQRLSLSITDWNDHLYALVKTITLTSHPTKCHSTTPPPTRWRSRRPSTLTSDSSN